jgi:hypothetical protein
MSGLFEAEDKITEEHFENITKGKNLSEVEREFLRRYYNLPYNIGLVSKMETFQNYVVIAWQKIKGNPMLQQH